MVFLWIVVVLSMVACKGGDGDGDEGGNGGAGASSGGGCSSFNGPFADRVIDYSTMNPYGATVGDWAFFFQEDTLIGAPGCVFDVASLGYDPGGVNALGGSTTLGLGTGGATSTPVCIIDGVGDDFAVFENPFVHTDPGSGTVGTNNEVVLVEVSEDNINWYDFPPDVDPEFALVEREHYINLAGVTPTAEGGDRFDLADAIAAHGLLANFRACYLRLSDGGTQWDDYGNTQSDLFASGADIDAVQALNYETDSSLTP